MKLAEKVKYKRKELGMTQEELAHKLGYKSKVSISNIEMGRPISQKIIVKLAEALQTTPSYLVGWDDEPKEEITRLLSALNESEYQEVINFIKFLIAKRGNL